MTLEGKDIAVLVGVAVTLVLGLWNLFENRVAGARTRFINTVTSQRILWIEQLRQDIASYIGLAGAMTYDGENRVQSQANDRQEIGRLLHVISLRLNPSAPVDKEIRELLDAIFKSAYAHTLGFDVAPKLSALSNKSQELMKIEWEKVKKEAIDGNLTGPRKRTIRAGDSSCTG